jgi:hypothetical protein
MRTATERSTERRFARRLDQAAWAAALVLVVAVLSRWTPNGIPRDFFQVWAIGQAVREMPVANVYDPAEKQRINDEFRRRGAALALGEGRYTAEHTRLAGTATPLHYSLVALTSSGVFAADSDRFRAASAIVHGASILALAWALGLRGSVALALLVIFTYGFYPFRSGMNFGNVSVLHAGLLGFGVAGLVARHAAARATTGFWLTLLAAVKPTLALVPVLLIVGMAVERRFKEAAWFAAGGAAAIGAAFWLPRRVLGSACTWIEWRRHLGDELLTDYWMTGGFLGKLTGAKDPRVYATLGVALFVATVALILWTAHSRRATSDAASVPWPRDAGIAGMGALLYLLSSPIVHSHYFVQAIPAALYSLWPAGPSSRYPWRRWTLTAVAIFLLGAHPLFKSLGWSRWPNHGLLTFAGVWILVGLVASAWIPVRNSSKRN